MEITVSMSIGLDKRLFLQTNPLFDKNSAVLSIADDKGNPISKHTIRLDALHGMLDTLYHAIELNTRISDDV